MSKREDWETVGEPLGEGGQSKVFLVRRPERSAERARCLKQIRTALDGDKRAELATAIWSYARPEIPSELGALKLFDKTRRGGAAAAERLKHEITVLQQKRPGLPDLLDANEAEQWMVTEFFPAGTLQGNLLRYKGQPVLALRAFRSLVETVAKSLHSDGIVHRDIKPANVFMGSDGSLIPGDFGIVYFPEEATRMTQEGERVGPWEYMPQWADLGTRLEKVEPNFDVYMLGKLLWCMVAGSPRLPREYHRRTGFDLTKMWPQDPHLYLINQILDNCLVEDPHECLSSAQDLLLMVNGMLSVVERGGQVLLPGVPRPCHVCGQGHYEQSGPAGSLRLWLGGSDTTNVAVETFICNVCKHVEFFRTAPR